MRMSFATWIRAALVGVVFAAPGVQASQFGCTVLLCLSNPAGATAVAECVPPIRQLWRDLAKGRPFPTCEEAGAGTQAGLVVEPFDPCPKGSTTLESGLLAAIAPTSPPPGRYATPEQVYTGIGEGNPSAEASPASPLASADGASNKVCVVGDPVGVGFTTLTAADSTTFAEVTLYRAIRLLEPQPIRIRVIVDDEVYTTVLVQKP
jgi:hypothetical protein